jgi:hypothetical protein
MSVPLKRQVVDWMGLDAVVLSSEAVQIVVLPEFGAKVVSLKDKVSDREWMYADSRRPLRHLPPGASFSESSLSGWDECFPSVAAGTYPGMAGIMVPDHGELWTESWHIVEDVDGLSCVCVGRSLRYTFRRTVTVAGGGRVHWSYLLSNSEDNDLVHGWSAHPLLAIGSGVSIDIAEGPMWPEFGDGVRIQSRENPLAGNGQSSSAEWHWPRGWNGTSGSDLRTLKPGDLLTDKVFLRTPVDGRIEVRDQVSGAKLTFELERSIVPFVGVCSNAGVSPAIDPQTWLAIEPTFASTDDLTVSLQRGHVGRVPAGASSSWQFDTVVG